MKQHLTMNVDHPFATPCAKCQHKLTASGTKDESVPHCAWAGRLRFVEFLALEPVEGGKSIPVCRQFAPKGRWADIIPAHPQKAIMPREWVKHQLHQIVLAHPYHLGSKLFEFLTGRPMNSNQKHGNWFWKQLKEQEHELSDEQLWTLLVWGMAEWRRRRGTNNPFMVPADCKNSHFISLREINFPQQ